MHLFAPKIIGGVNAPSPVGEFGMIQMTQALKQDVDFKPVNFVIILLPCFLIMIWLISSCLFSTVCSLYRFEVLGKMVGFSLDDSFVNFLSKRSPCAVILSC